MTNLSIDLNADLGEECGDDAAMLSIVTSANIACGGHAGGDDIMATTMRLAGDHGVRIGLHPSYPDRRNFGRESLLKLAPAKYFLSDIRGQLEDALTTSRALGLTVTHIKPHGALYNDAMVRTDAADIVIRATMAVQRDYPNTIALMGLPGSVLEQRAQEAGIPYIREGFADRAYASDGTLVPRSQPGAVLTDHDAVLAQATALARGTVTTITGDTIPMPVQSICVHGDTPGAVTHARAIAAALDTHPSVSGDTHV